jgi:hypothetical protein
MYKPEYLLADASDAITKGFEETFGKNYHFKRIMCWFHMLKCVEKQLNKVSDE